MIRIATVGSNTIVDRVLSAMAACPQFVHEAVYSRTAQRGQAFAQAHGVRRVYTDYATLLAQTDIDAIYIATPNSLHFAQALQALQAGKHVLLEKPAVPTVAQWQALQQAAREKHCVLLEAMRPVHAPGLEALRGMLPRVGQVRRATFSFCQYSSRYDAFRRGVVENAFDPSFANGALMDIGVYCVSQMEYLFGAPQSVWGQSVRLHTGVDGEGLLVCGYEGMLCECRYSKITTGYTPSTIEGEDGTLVLDNSSCVTGFTLYPRGGEAERFDMEEAVGGDITYELNHFAHMIAHGQDERYWQHSGNVINVMETARQQMGLDFRRL